MRMIPRPLACAEGETEEQIGFAGEVVLGVICLTVEMDVVCSDDIAKGQEVYDEEKSPVVTGEE